METAEVDTAIGSDPDDRAVAVVMRSVGSPLLHVHTGARAQTIHAIGPVGSLRESDRAMALGCKEEAESTFKPMLIHRGFSSAFPRDGSIRQRGAPKRPTLRAHSLWNSPRLSVDFGNKGLEQTVRGPRILQLKASGRGVI